MILGERNHQLIEEDTPMTLSDTDTAQLWETFRAGGGAELVRSAVRLVLQEADRGRGHRGDRRRAL